MAATKVRRDGQLRTRGLYRAIGSEIRQQREDAGLSQHALADAAEITQGHESAIEAGIAAPSVEILQRIAIVLGADLGMRFFAAAGPRIRDRFQARMIEALLRIVGPRWRPYLEVAVQQPSRGFIDLVLADSRRPQLVATEAHSDLRRVEQQVRWALAKADGLAFTDLAAMLRATAAQEAALPIGRLLLLRSTQRTREIVRSLPAVMSAAYPARTADVLEALTSQSAAWPGDGIVWTTSAGRTLSILGGPPRGVQIGR